MSGDRSFQAVVADLGAVPKELRKELRPRLRQVAAPIAAGARRRASWSTRIPRAIRTSVSFSVQRPGVRIRVDGKAAPHARAYEGLSGMTFKHPVFGRDVWVTQQARPFLFPAARKAAPDVARAVNDAVQAAAKKHGFKVR